MKPRTHGAGRKCFKGTNTTRLNSEFIKFILKSKQVWKTTGWIINPLKEELQFICFHLSRKWGGPECRTTGFTKCLRDDGDGIDRVKRKVLFISKEYICLAYRWPPPLGQKSCCTAVLKQSICGLNNEGYLFMCLREMLPVWRHAASGTALLMERRRPPADRRPALWNRLPDPTPARREKLSQAEHKRSTVLFVDLFLKTDQTPARLPLTAVIFTSQLSVVLRFSQFSWPFSIFCLNCTKHPSLTLWLLDRLSLSQHL